MLLRVLSVFVLLSVASANENPCKGKQLKGCDDSISSCGAVFTPLADGSANDKCFDPTDGDYQMTSLCKKTCQLCCQDVKYNCDDDPIPDILCPTSEAECNQFSDINFAHCKSSCGWCDQKTKPCTDTIDTAACRTYKNAQGNLCSNPEVFTQCEKTCEICFSADCEDVSDRCSVWVKNGFCLDPFYTADKASYCKKSCDICA